MMHSSSPVTDVYKRQWVPKAQAREAKATAAGHTKVAARIGARIAKVQKWETRGTTVLGKISAKCGSTTSAQ